MEVKNASGPTRKSPSAPDRGPIPSHAFYLAVEGRTNAETGLSVEGRVGRYEIEDIFFRALKELMPQATSLPQAADAIRQAAADLAAGGSIERLDAR